MALGGPSPTTPSTSLSINLIAVNGCHRINHCNPYSPFFGSMSDTIATIDKAVSINPVLC